MVYELYNERGANGTISVSYGCMIYDRSIESGESVLFSVPLLHFKKGADVGVRFNYASEEHTVSAIREDFGHYVFFRKLLSAEGCS